MVAISIGVLAVWAAVNALRIDRVAWIMNVSSVWQVGSRYIGACVRRYYTHSIGYVVPSFGDYCGW